MLDRETNVLLRHDVIKISVFTMTELLFTYVLDTSIGLGACREFYFQPNCPFLRSNFVY